MTIPFIGAGYGDSPALLDDEHGRWLNYRALRERAGIWRDELAESDKCLVFLFADNDIASVSAFLGAMAAGHAVALLDPKMSASARADLISLYRPEILVSAEPVPFTNDEACTKQFDGKYIANRLSEDRGPAIHPGLDVLLSTSGSTGSPKFVRLRRDSIEHNAKAIAQVLTIRPNDVGAGHLHLHYSYGLSVLTSCLASGASVALTRLSLMDRGFWTNAQSAGVTHMPGVPFHYQMIHRLGFERIKLDRLRTMTQAGGRLDVDIQKSAHEFMAERGGAFYVMYGQTEAAPRMTTLDHKDFADYPNSVGTALPGGGLEVRDENQNVLGPGQEGEVYYCGANVMMGYAKCREDLALGDELKGELRTGDIGSLDRSGHLTITGRSKRIGKVYGWRVNLDEIEEFVRPFAEVAVVQVGDSLKLHTTEADRIDTADLMDALSRHFSLPKRVYQVIQIDAIPLTQRGKIDYKLLEIGAQHVQPVT